MIKMRVLSLCQKNCPDKIPSNLSIKLGNGIDGEVYALKKENSKAIKFSFLTHYYESDLETEYSKIESVIKYIKNNSLPCYANVYSFERLIKSWIEIYKDIGQVEQKDEYIIYSYVMEKCFPLSEDEVKVFHSLISHEDLGIEKNYSLPIIKKMLAGLSRGLDFDVKKITLFFEQIKSCEVIQKDLHPRNIMKNDLGYFKIVDLDRCYFKLGENDDAKNEG